MNRKSITQTMLLVTAAILLTSCSSQFGHFSGNSDGSNTSTHGLGELNAFANQEEGESYTTQAPHNQVYLFDYDSNNVSPKYIDSINAQAHYLKSHPGAHILLAGHTDERGSREYNVALGERRANAVAELMQLAGASRKQMRVVSYGKERPAFLGHDKQSYHQNRRVELTYEATR